jgi:hypothetical protein
MDIVWKLLRGKWRFGRKIKRMGLIILGWGIEMMVLGFDSLLLGRAKVEMLRVWRVEDGGKAIMDKRKSQWR